MQSEWFRFKEVEALELITVYASLTGEYKFKAIDCILAISLHQIYLHTQGEPGFGGKYELYKGLYISTDLTDLVLNFKLPPQYQVICNGAINLNNAWIVVHEKMQMTKVCRYDIEMFKKLLNSNWVYNIRSQTGKLTFRKFLLSLKLKQNVIQKLVDDAHTQNYLDRVCGNE